MGIITQDVLNINKEYQSYGEYKRALDQELQGTAERFVRIGYLLKLAADTDILKESGYQNVNEFAQAEYGLDKTQVSRFININNKFSEEGYSDQLKEHYRGFGYAKLAIMLRLPEVINRELSADFSKAEIQEIKEEVDAEQRITDLEVMMEGQNLVQRDMDTNMSKALHQLLYENHDLAADIWKAVKKWNPQDDNKLVIREIHEILAPNQAAMHSVRVHGVGRMIISIKGTEDTVKIINIRNENEAEEYNWEEMLYELWGLINTEEDSAMQWWEKAYGEKFPEKQKVAPVQQKEGKTEKEKRKTSRITKAKISQNGGEKQEKKQENHQQEPESRQPVRNVQREDADSGQSKPDDTVCGEKVGYPVEEQEPEECEIGRAHV